MASVLPSTLPTILIYPVYHTPSLAAHARALLWHFPVHHFYKMASDSKERSEHNAIEEVFEFYHDSGDELNTE